MAYKYGKQSLANFQGVHPKLVKLYKTAITYNIYDIVIVGGGRTIETQKLYVLKGVSKTMNSMHLMQPDGYYRAIDSVPWPDFDWNAKGYDRDLLLYHGWLLGIASTMPEMYENGKLIFRYGGDWNGDWKNSDNGFQDLDHLEIPWR